MPTMPTMLPFARTNAEAHLYMARQPCACGARGFAGAIASAVGEDAGALVSRYRAVCAGCGAGRAFAFRLPEAILPPPVAGVRFGGDEPSQLLDPGEWLAIADEHSRRVAAGARDDRALAIAVAAIDEALKFVPPGGDACPAEVFRSAAGRAMYDAEPGRFRRARLAAARAALAAGITGAGGGGRPVPGP